MIAFPEPSELSEVLGPDSPVAHAATAHLAALYHESESLPPVANSFRAWGESRSADADTSPDAFLRHTCLSILCRLMSYRFLEPSPSKRALWDIISGNYFVSAGLSNFLCEDFFSWPYFRRSMGIGEDTQAIEVAGNLLAALKAYDFTAPPPALLSSLYRAYAGKSNGYDEGPNPVEIQKLTDNPYLTCIAPRCGEGGALASSVSAAMAGRQALGQHSADAMLDSSAQFLGLTSDPLAAGVASVSFLFSLGNSVREPHPPILIPIYFADIARIPEERTGSGGNRVCVIRAAGDLVLPERVAADPLYLDWLLGRLPNYQRGAALRLRAQPEAEALSEVLNAWYNYLTSPKARTPIPDPLTPADADVMVEAARALITAYIRGFGPVPLHLARNAPAPLFAARREFDLTI